MTSLPKMVWRPMNILKINGDIYQQSIRSTQNNIITFQKENKTLKNLKYFIDGLINLTAYLYLTFDT